jgi:hypothetical protein
VGGVFDATQVHAKRVLLREGGRERKREKREKREERMARESACEHLCVCVVYLIHIAASVYAKK